MAYLIEDIGSDSTDASGNRILCIFAKKPPEYLVYSDPMRVMVQFADDPRAARRQRMALASLNPLRGQISGLIDGWRTSKKANVQARARRYDRRVADAIIICLEGGIADALALLTEIRDDIIAERRSYAQTDYLLVAALSGIAFIILIWILSSPMTPISKLPRNSGIIWTGAAGGTIGAFFSVATALRTRTILIDLQQWDNRRDAILRLAVGTIGAGILICLFLTGLVTLAGIGRATLTTTEESTRVLVALVIGFIAGFSERAVPDLLSRVASTVTQDGADEDVAAVQAKAASSPLAHGMAAAAAAAAAALNDDEEDSADQVVDEALGEDSCLCDAPPLAGELLTEDQDLPIAVGGVSADEPAPVTITPPEANEVGADDDQPQTAQPNQPAKHKKP